MAYLSRGHAKPLSAMALHYFCASLGMVVAVSGNGDQARCCRFSRLFEDADWNDKSTQDRFVRAVLHHERRFFAGAGIAFDADTGMTYDGHPLDPATGEL